MVLELDPGARLVGPVYIGNYRTYAVKDSAGVQIGYTDGNEGSPAFAWARAFTTLSRRKGQQ